MGTGHDRGVTRGTRALVAALLTVALASGCMASQETRRGADALEEALGTPDWAESVSVTSGLDGQLADEVVIEVALGDGADAAALTSFVVDLGAHVVDAGLEDIPANKNLTFVSPYGDRLAIAWRPTTIADEVNRGVAEWIRLIGSGPGENSATLESDGGASYVLELGDGSRSWVGDRVEVLRDITEPDTAWQLNATADGVSFELSGTLLPNGKQLGVWRGLVDALDGLPADLPASELSLHYLDRIVVDVTFVVPDETTSETFTIEAYGDRIWPVVHPQLDAMRTLSDEWSYFANWAPTYAPTSRNGFISLLTDLPTTDNGDESTRWSRAAKDYISD